MHYLNFKAAKVAHGSHEIMRYPNQVQASNTSGIQPWLYVIKITIMVILSFVGLQNEVNAESDLEIPPPPPLPEESDEGAVLGEPEVIIIHQHDKTIEEYRINGKLSYVKITPSKGPSYYMIDTDGDGILDIQRDHLEFPLINQWILWRW